MFYVTTEDLAPEMVTAKPVYDRRAQKLLSAGMLITQKIIRAAGASGIQGMFIEDPYTAHEEPEEVLSEPDRARAMAALEKMDIRAAAKEGEAIAELMASQGGRAVDIKDLRLCRDDPYAHAVNVAILACACGLGMGIGGQRLVSLAQAALMHDIGKYRMPKGLWTVDKETLKDGDRRALKRHPETGHSLLYDEQALDAEARAGVLLHHERYDGKGYPKGYSGEKIPVFARIIAVANAYDYVSQRRSFSGGLAQHEAVERLMGGCGTEFDTAVVAEFLKYAALYPAGTDVVLSDGREAVVVRNRPPFMERPVVVLKATGEELDLSSSGSLSLTIMPPATDAGVGDGGGAAPAGG